MEKQTRRLISRSRTVFSGETGAFREKVPAETPARTDEIYASHGWTTPYDRIKF
jgi:hypothetical protein